MLNAQTLSIVGIMANLLRLEGDDRPRSLRDPKVRARRRAMLDLPHIAPLTRFAQQLRSRRLGEVPDFDPLDGGIDAEALFVFQKPGPMTAAEGNGLRAGSGFISRNNDDQTAAATYDFMDRAGIPRQRTVTWNIVPYWNGTAKDTKAEMEDGVEALRQLTAPLPRLRAIVLVGNKAGRAARHLSAYNLAIFTSALPSPLVRATLPTRWNAIPGEWAKVASILPP